MRISTAFSPSSITPTTPLPPLSRVAAGPGDGAEEERRKGPDDAGQA